MESDNTKNETGEEPKLIQDIEHAHPEVLSLPKGEIKLIEDVEHAHPEILSLSKGDEKRSLWEKLKRIFKR